MCIAVLPVFHTSASEVVGQKALVYQKAAEDEFKRRQDLQRLQNGLEPEGCSGQEKGISTGACISKPTGINEEE